MVRFCPALSKRVKILESQKKITYLPTNSSYQVLSADVANKHGFNTHGVIFDELHTQPNRKLFDVMLQGSGDARMQPLYFLITTAGNDTNSICYEVHQKALDIQAGSIYYNVRFFDGTNTDPIYTTHVAGGEDAQDPVAARLISVPYKDSESTTAFRYTGWDKPLTGITGDTDFIAQYVEDVGYVVTFKDWDDTVLCRRIAAHGSTVPDPVQSGVIGTPTRPNDANYAYIYLGWTGGSLSNITSDRTLTARYTTRPSYTVTFVDWNNEELCHYYITTGQDCPDPIEEGVIHQPEHPEDTENQIAYTFTGWSMSLRTVTSNRTIRANYSAYSYVYAIFTNWDDTELYRERVRMNGTITDPVAGGRMAEPEKPAAEYNYFFRKWDKMLPATLTTNTTFKALFKTDEMFAVTFLDYDNSVLDVQYVSQYNNAVDPVAAGRIQTPVRPSNPQYYFEYDGWMTSLNEIISDRTIYIRYTYTLRSYPVRYYDSDGETLIASRTLNYGYSPVLQEEIVKPGVNDPEDYYLYLWEPATAWVSGPVDYTANWHHLISDTWTQILEAGSDGTYSQKYSVGDVAMLDLGDEGEIPFELVAKDTDVLADDTGSAHMTWLALAPLATQRPIGFKGTGAMNSYGGFSLVSQGAEGTMYRSAHIGGSKGCASQFTITANEALSMRIVCTCSSEENFDMMSVSVNGVWIVSGFGKAEGVTEERTYQMASGDTLTVIAQYVKDTSVDGGRDCAEITFVSAGSFSISKTDPAYVLAAGGSAGGWPSMPLREKLTSEVLPCFPANVRSAIKPVKKISAITPYNQAETTDTLWIPSRRECSCTVRKQATENKR